MTAALEIYDSALTAAKGEQIELGETTPGGGYIDLGSYKIRNDGDSTATNIRIGCRCLNGLYSGQDNNLGQEIVTEQAVEASVNGGSWTQIGGDFSVEDPAENYIALPDIDAGNSSNEIKLRMAIPADFETVGVVVFQGLVVSFEE